MTKSDFTAAMVVFADSASPDELTVVAKIAERMLSGQAVYGRLDLSSDPRDMVAEAFAESADMTVYLAAQMVRDGRAVEGVVSGGEELPIG